MLKISQVGATDQSVTLKLEGRVAGLWVGEVRKVCELLLNKGCAVQLDLEDVSFVDATGTATISNLKSRGVALGNCSPFVAEQLKSHVIN
jgi:ABC-type transporter Mla MlaB component